MQMSINKFFIEFDKKNEIKKDGTNCLKRKYIVLEPDLSTRLIKTFSELYFTTIETATLRYEIESTFFVDVINSSMTQKEPNGAWVSTSLSIYIAFAEGFLNNLSFKDNENYYLMKEFGGDSLDLEVNNNGKIKLIYRQGLLKIIGSPEMVYEKDEIKDVLQGVQVVKVVLHNYDADNTVIKGVIIPITHNNGITEKTYIDYKKEMLRRAGYQNKTTKGKYLNPLYGTEIKAELNGDNSTGKTQSDIEFFVTKALKTVLKNITPESWSFMTIAKEKTNTEPDTIEQLKDYTVEENESNDFEIVETDDDDDLPEGINPDGTIKF